MVEDHLDNIRIQYVVALDDYLRTCRNIDSTVSFNECLDRKINRIRINKRFVCLDVYDYTIICETGSRLRYSSVPESCGLSDLTPSKPFAFTTASILTSSAATIILSTV